MLVAAVFSARWRRCANNPGSGSSRNLRLTRCLSLAWVLRC